MSVPPLKAPRYPVARRNPVQVEVHNTSFTDPYRWLEDLDSAETKAWVDEQLQLTRSFLDDKSFESMRTDVMERLKLHYTYDKKSLPMRRGSNWFYSCKKGLQNQSVLYITGATPEGEGEIFFDVNGESEDGTTSISSLAFERQGAHYALLGLRERGSDWSSVYWFDTVRRAVLRPPKGPEEVSATLSDGSDQLGVDVVRGKFMGTSLVQTPGKTGFFYSSYPTQATAAVLRAKGLWSDAAVRGSDSATSKDTHYAAWWHADGTPQSSDVPMFMLKGHEADWFYGLSLTTDQRYAVVSASNGCDPACNVYVASFDSESVRRDAERARAARLAGQEEGERVAPELRFVTFATGMDTKWDYVHNYVDGDDEVFLFLTDKPSPKQQLKELRVPLKVFETAPTTPLGVEPPKAEGILEKEIISASETEVLDNVWAGYRGEFLWVCHTVDVCDVVSLYSLQGKFIRRLRLPVGTIGEFSSTVFFPDVYLRMSSYVSAGTDFHIDTSSSVFRAAISGSAPADGPVVQGVTVDEFVKYIGTVEVPGFSPNDYKTDLEFYDADDGAKIPIFITHHVSLAAQGKAGSGMIEGPHPCQLYGYGGFNISVQPSFSTMVLPWLAVNGFRGVFAVANIRGGGEYGHQWYKVAVKEKKHVSWDDFATAAKYLSKSGWTSPQLLSIRGGSNGGLLVSSTALRAPDAIGAYVAEVGVFDLTRFHTSHVGAAWRCDYGDPDTEDICYIAKASPTLVVERAAAELKGRMPPGLVITADHDDRVSPFHSFKFVSAAQYALPDTLTLCRLERNTGHGAGRPTSKILAEKADMYVFLARVLGLKWHSD